MAKGKVKFFNAKKGYGFIAGEDGKDVFVHFSAILSDGYKTLNAEDEVEYEVVTGNGGKKQASNVRTV